MEKQVRIHAWGYAIFIVVSLLFLIRQDYFTAFIFWALAVVFDPFDQNVPFSKRPTWQKIWLVVHTLSSIVLLVLLIRSDTK